MRQQIAGKSLHIESKYVQCPRAPLFIVKSFGHVVEIQQDRVAAHNFFEQCIASDRELWKLDDKGIYHLLRLMRGGTEKQA